MYQRVIQNQAHLGMIHAAHGPAEGVRLSARQVVRSSVSINRHRAIVGRANIERLHIQHKGALRTI